MLIYCKEAYSNDSILIRKLFQTIAHKQVQTDSFFKAGSFKSYRLRGGSAQLKEDNNIFFTALIVFTLKELKPYLTAEENSLAENIIQQAAKAYPSYKNQKGRNTYNFWTTKKPTLFPNEGMLNWFNQSASLPDDLDDTGIILSNLDVPDSIAAQVHLLMQQHANGKFSFIKNTFKSYQKIPAYSTWFGVKMPADFDFGVHCNILYFINKYHLKWTATDSATLQLIVKEIKNKHHLTHPEYISPYYYQSPVLMYHLARLMQYNKIAALDSLKDSLISQTKELLHKEKNTLNKVLLTNSLMKWGVMTTDSVLSKSVFYDSLNTTAFVYYTGHLFGHLNNNIKNTLGKLNATKFNWYCSAYNDCLLLEYLVLKNRRMVVTPQ